MQTGHSTSLCTQATVQHYAHRLHYIFMHTGYSTDRLQDRQAILRTGYRTGCRTDRLQDRQGTGQATGQTGYRTGRVQDARQATEQTGYSTNRLQDIQAAGQTCHRTALCRMVTGERQRLVSCSTGHGQSLRNYLKAIIRLGLLGLYTFQGPQRPSGDGTLCTVQACGIMVT